MNVSIEVDPVDGHDDSIEAEVDHQMALRHPIDTTTRWIKSKLISFYNSHTIWSFVLICCQIFLLGFIYIYPFTMMVERAARMSSNGNFSLWERLPNQTRINTTIELYVDTPGGSMILFSTSILVQMMQLYYNSLHYSHMDNAVSICHVLVAFLLHYVNSFSYLSTTIIPGSIHGKMDSRL